MRNRSNGEFIFFSECIELEDCPDVEIWNKKRIKILKPSNVFGHIDGLINKTWKRIYVHNDIPKRVQLWEKITFSQEEYDMMVKVMEENDVLTMAEQGVRYFVFFKDNFLFVQYNYCPVPLSRGELKRKNGEYYIDEIFIDVETIKKYNADDDIYLFHRRIGRMRKDLGWNLTESRDCF